ncbi:MAG TPA: FAD-dependent oxidoreductase [Firmicutes bacterium]|nr:FAD-dependent oxidoreductase [Bacillota bacterium]
MNYYDVIVVGGGVSGAIAGIASARLGAKTLIIEKMGFLGGMLTAGGVGPMMTFHAGSLQVVRGIADEVIKNLEKMGGSPGHIVDTTGYTYTVTPFDAELMKHVLEKMYLDASGEIMYHSFFCDVKVTCGEINQIKVATKSGLLELTATVFVDASGDGDLAAWAGVPFLLGRPGDHLSQPLTMNFKLGQVNIVKLKDYILSHPEEFPEAKAELLNQAPRLSMGGFTKILATGQKNSEITFSRECILLFETNNPGEVIVNTTRIQKVNPTDVRELSNAEVEGRRQALELFYFMKHRVPGFEDALFMSSGPNIGVRESRKIQGKYILTAEDLLGQVVFADEIACGGYPVDVHSPDGEGTDSCHLKWGAVYGIPYRSLINGKVSNLINVGRCISATHEACAAIRVSPIAMAMGQAGGTAAALAVQKNSEVTNLEYHYLREQLLNDQVYLRSN